MCLPPLLIAGAALALGGAGLNYMGQRKADHAMTRTFSRERSRQDAFEKDQIARFEDSLASTGNVADPAAMAAAAAAREKVSSAVTKSAAGSYLPGSASANKIVADHKVVAGKAADGRTGSLAHALASLGGVGDLMQQNAINIGRNSGAIDQIGGFKRGSLDVLQSEMDAAKRKGSTLRTLGSLAQTIGSAMISGGAGGAPIGASSPSNFLIPAGMEDIYAGIGAI